MSPPPVRLFAKRGEFSLAKRREVLILAHDAKATGGVNNFVRVLRVNIRRRVRASRFANGRRRGESGKLQAIRRLAWDYLRFAALLACRPFAVVQANPSFDRQSLPRELMFVWIAKLIRPKTKVVVFYHGWDWGAVEGIKQSSLLARLFKATHRRIDHVLVLTSPFKASLGEMGVAPDKVSLVTTMFEGDVMAQAVKQTPHKDWNTLVFMSRFLPAKGGGVTIEAFSRLAARYPDLRLVMAGDGPDRPNLDALVAKLGLEDRVEFPGYLGSGPKMKLLAAAGIFLLPTAHPEGMPVAILEAMAAGSVIISTPIGGTADVVERGQNGVLLDEVTAETVAEAIERYLADHDLAETTSAANRQKAWSLWESAIVSNRIADHYDRLCAT